MRVNTADVDDYERWLKEKGYDKVLEERMKMRLGCVVEGDEEQTRENVRQFYIREGAVTNIPKPNHRGNSDLAKSMGTLIGPISFYQLELQNEKLLKKVLELEKLVIKKDKQIENLKNKEHINEILIEKDCKIDELERIMIEKDKEIV